MYVAVVQGNLIARTTGETRLSLTVVSLTGSCFTQTTSAGLVSHHPFSFTNRIVSSFSLAPPLVKARAHLEVAAGCLLSPSLVVLCVKVSHYSRSFVNSQTIMRSAPGAPDFMQMLTCLHSLTKRRRVHTGLCWFDAAARLCCVFWLNTSWRIKAHSGEGRGGGGVIQGGGRYVRAVVGV